VEANPNLQIALGGIVKVDGSISSRFYGLLRELGDTHRVVLLLVRDEVGHCHVGIAYGLYLEDLVFVGQRVELRVQTIEHVRHLGGVNRLRDLSEANNVAEENSHLLAMLRVHLVPRHELVSNVFGENVMEKTLLRGLFVLRPTQSRRV
jgi:hypothetical protein